MSNQPTYMNKLIIPTTILIVQILGLIFYFYIDREAPPDAPVGVVLIHFYALCNVIVLIASYFGYFTRAKKSWLWLLPITIALINIVIVVVMQIMMAIGKL